MFNFISFPTSIGIELSSSGIKGAKVVADYRSSSLKEIFHLRTEIEDVKRLYMNHPLLTTALGGREVLVRPLQLPLTKERDIEAALTFQIEPLLPYAADQALLAYQIIEKTPENTDLTCLAGHKEAVQSHLESWQALQLEPEKISCVPAALCQFGKHYFPSHKAFLMLHVQSQEMTCVLIKEGKLWASFTHSEGLELLLQTKEEPFPQNEMEWFALEQNKNSPLAEALKRLQKEVTRMSFALAKELKGEEVEGIIVTGEVMDWEGCRSVLVRHLPFTLLQCDPRDGYSSQELHSYAVPIGLAWGSLSKESPVIDFRQQEFSYPHPWRRLLKPVALYFVGILVLSFAFYVFGQQYLHHQEDQLKQNYLDLLSGMHKTHEHFEVAFLAKNPSAHDAFNGEMPRIEQMKQEDLIERLVFLQKELQGTPDSFPLFANIPRVSDVLAWLSQHPTVAFVDEEGKPQTRLQIENFSYTMLKRPQQGKKQEKYQVKIELEFSSPTPKSAREFHDALIAPNDWVDPKGEVKWSANRGKYKTSFFLKDKTIYPSS